MYLKKKVNNDTGSQQTPQQGRFSNGDGEFVFFNVGGVINIGFDFVFYGNTYNQVVLASNNYLSFNLANANQYCDFTIDAAIPTNLEPETQNGILCPWQDINPGANGNGTIQYATIGEAPNRVFIVSFCGIPMFQCSDICYSSQIKLFENTASNKRNFYRNC